MLELNKIHLGDSYTLIKSIPDKSIDCVYVDIPYLYSGSLDRTCKTNELAMRIRKYQNELEAIRDGIDYSILDEFVRVLKKVNVFIWCSRAQVIDLLKYFVCEHKCSFEILVWAKCNPVPQTNNVWLSDLEYCLYFREVGVRLNDGYELKSKWYESVTNKKDKDLFLHPTCKPLNLVKRHLLHATNANDIVLDCFIGSGTTAVACKEINRKFIGIEIDQKWHKIACDRLNNIDAHGQVSFLAR